MANYFNLTLGSTDPIDLYAEAVNKNDPYIWVRVYGDYTLSVGCKIRALIVPSGTVWEDGEILSKLQGPLLNDTSSGIYSTECVNNTDKDLPAFFNDIKINKVNNIYNSENTEYELHWILQRGSDFKQGSYSGWYTYCHNIQPNEILISGGLTSNNSMEYMIHWNSLNNEESDQYVNYYGPYRIAIQYAYSDDFVKSWTYYPAGTMQSGIYFNLPFYDDRLDNIQKPAMYQFNIANVGCNSSSQLDSNVNTIFIDHQKFVDSDNNSFKNLDEYAFATAKVNTSLINKVDEKTITNDVIDRRRLSIGINDISVKDNVFVKQGVYVSPYYPLDVSLYTLSLKVDEHIPNYPGINPYDVVQYFIEINSSWERISPINREDESLNGELIPKILVFDKGTSDNSQIKYIDLSVVRIFRVKIVFDLTKITDSKFSPPEIRDFKCIIFDKDQLNEL